MAVCKDAAKYRGKPEQEMTESVRKQQCERRREKGEKKKRFCGTASFPH